MKHDTLTELQQAPVGIRQQYQESIFHNSQIEDTGFDIVVTTERITDVVYSERIIHYTEQILQVVDESYQILADQTNETPDINDITDTALGICLQRAVEAKAEGRQEDATSNLQSVLLLNGLKISDEQVSTTMLRVVENGLALDLLQAGKPLLDIQVRDPKYQRRITPAIEGIRVFQDLLGIAVGTGDVVEYMETDRYPKPPTIEQRRAQYDGLNSLEAIALAKYQANNLHNHDAAAHTALLALEKAETNPYLFQGHNDVAKVLIDVHNIVATSDAHSSSDSRTEQLNHTMSQLRLHRAPNLHPYRVNIPLCDYLDEAVVTLVAAERPDIAAKLMSGAAGEEKQIQGTLSNRAEILFSDRYDEIKSQIETIYQHKRAELETGLHNLGIRSDLIIDFTHNLPCPEKALDIPQNQWNYLQRLPNPVIESVVSNSSIDIKSAIEILQLIGPALSDNDVAYVFNHTYIKDNSDTQIARTTVKELCELVVSINDINQNRATGTETIHPEYAIERLKQRYTDPVKTLEAFKRRYPRAGYGEFITYCIEPFSNNRYLLNPEQQQRYDAIHDKFEGICDRSSIMNIGSEMDLCALENLDPEKLRAALDRIITKPEESTGKIPIIKEEIKESRILSVRLNFIHILRNLQYTNPEDLNNYVTRFLDVPTDIFEAYLSYAQKDPDYGALTRQLVNTAGDTPEEYQVNLQRIRATIQCGLIDFIETDSVMESYQKFKLTRQLLERSDGKQLIPLLKTGEDLLGQFLTIDNLNLLANIMYSDTVSDEFVSLGVTKPGEAGINQLKNFLDKFTQHIFDTGNIPVGLIVKHPFLADYVKTMTRYETSQFGRHDREEFLALLTTSERGNFQIGPEYSIGQASIAVKDSKALAEFIIPEDAVHEWRGYAHVLRAAQEIVPPNGPIAWSKFGDVLLAIQQDAASRRLIMSSGMEKLREKIETFAADGRDTDKLQAKLGQQQDVFDTLSDIDFQNVEDFNIYTLCRMIQALSEHNSIAKTGNLQTLLVATALLKNRYDEHVPPEIDFRDKSPNLQQIGEMTDLIGHLTNQEVWGPLFSDIGGEKQLQNLLSIDALTNTLQRSLSISTKGQRTIRFLPTRDALMELSGHIADACWASKYDSLADLHPNTTSVIFIQNPETATRRMVGAMFLIETVSAEGEPLLVIRGLNPLENIINDLDPKSFVDEVAIYAREIAENQGRKLAIVIDGHSGGSSTNRPALFAYLSGIRGALQKISLASELDTTINNYNIVDDTYLI